MRSIDKERGHMKLLALFLLIPSFAQAAPLTQFFEENRDGWAAY